ncbi:MAG: methylated-DNA--[protein]-cysteine S-methyltransferase [Candidatus Bathyarchaeota archaeon]|nr:methylated-DNA--[protein]-cysteine S-methyltransferase [Candidatus Bathyarchaeota archaeon]
MLTLHVKAVKGVWFGVAYENENVFATSFAFDRKRALQSLLKSIPYDIPFQHLEKPTEFADKVVSSLKNIYDGQGCDEKFSLAMGRLSDYAQKVLRTVSLVPVGYVASYGSVAKAAGGGPRAVGWVMASNPFPLIIPCHRVVASDFSLGGYGGGVHVKLEILKREEKGYTSTMEIKVNDGVLKVFPVEFVLRRLKEQHK